jgi:hypothetical protein
MAYKSDKCWVCLNLRPVDSHHVVPLEYGGKKQGTQVMLCESCHGTLHKEAEHYHKTGKFQHLFDIYTNAVALDKIQRLITALLRAKNLYLSGAGVDNNDQRRMTQISWPSETTLQIAHAVKKSRGFKSLDRLIQTLVAEEAIRLKSKGKF